MSVVTDTRLGLLKWTTKQYILDDPHIIVLNRQTKVNKPGGGHDFPKMPIAPQTFRFINQDIGDGIVHGVDDATARSFRYVMVGMPDADVNINDSWVEGENQYRVDAIVPNNGWESRCYVTAFAKEPDKG